jgi:hypothetical protein
MAQQGLLAAVAAVGTLLPLIPQQVLAVLVAARLMVKVEPLELLDKATLVEMEAQMLLLQIRLTAVVAVEQVLLVAQGLLLLVEMAAQALQTQLLELLGCPQTLLLVVEVVVALQTVAAQALPELGVLPLGATAVRLVFLGLTQL